MVFRSSLSRISGSEKCSVVESTKKNVRKAGSYKKMKKMACGLISNCLMAGGPMPSGPKPSGPMASDPLVSG